MATFKGVFKKLTTLDGMIKVLVVFFLLNLTSFGRGIMTKLKSLFSRGLGGV